MSAGRIPTTANSPLTTKGDLFTYSTSPARLAVGANGEQIVADSSTSTGLRYTAGTVQANPVLNSAMQIWQRGTTSSSITTAATYTADRWASVSGASTAMVVSRQATGDTTNLPNIQYCSRVQKTAGQTGTSVLYFAQSIESINSIPFAGKTVTLSFYARKGANYSQATSIVSAYLQTGTGTDQNILSGGLTGAVNAIAQDATLTTTWQRFSYTGTIGATVTQLAMFFSYAPVGTAGAADYFEITGVQIDIGSVALPFRTNNGTIQGELAACQRYYEKTYDLDSAPGAVVNQGLVTMYLNGVTTTAAGNNATFKVTKRGTPTMTFYSNTSGASGKVRDANNAVDVNATDAFIGTQGSSVTWAQNVGTINIRYHWVASAEL